MRDVFQCSWDTARASLVPMSPLVPSSPLPAYRMFITLQRKSHRDTREGSFFRFLFFFGTSDTGHETIPLGTGTVASQRYQLLQRI